MSSRIPSPAWRRTALVCGGSLTLFGSATVVGWACGQEWLTQFHTRFRPLHYHAAALIVAWGLGWLAVAANRLLAARVAAAVVFAGGLFGLLLKWAGWADPLTGWAFAADPRLFPPGGVGEPAGAAFLLAGLGLWVKAGRSGGRIGGWVLVASGVVLVVGAVAGLVNSPLLLGSPNRPGQPLTLVASCLVGGVMTLTAGTAARWGKLPLRYALTGGVWVGGLIASFILWDALNARQDERTRRTVQLDAADAQMVLEKGLTDCLTRLTTSAARVRGIDHVTEETDPELNLYIGNRNGVLGVARLVPGRQTEWVIPAGGLPNSDRGWTFPELSEAVDAGRPAFVRPPRSRWNGQRLLYVYAPIHPGRAEEGGLVAVVRLNAFIDAVWSQNVAAGYTMEIWDGGDLIYTHGTTDEGSRAYAAEQTLRVSTLGWRVRVRPTPSVLDRERSVLPPLVLVAGIGLFTLLAVAVALAQTARRRAADLLRSEAKHRSLVEQLTQGVYLRGGDGRYLAANPSYCRLVGRTEGELIGRTDDGLAVVGDSRWADDDARVLADGKAAEFEGEVTVGSERRTIRRMLTPLTDDGRPGATLGVVWDVTEQRALEARLRQAGKLDALGQLAGGIAHDFNNLLTGIIGNLDLLRRRTPPDDPRAAFIDSAQTAAGRATELTGRLLGFARQHQLDRRPTDLGEVVSEVVALLRRTIDPRVRIETHTPPAVGLVHADPSQLHQVLMNLCLNARDAIAGAGCIRVELTPHTRPPGHPGGRGGRYVRLRVSDTGAGMPPEVKARIFEPFFTTKGVGKGTGLGLAMVHGIVEQHCGWIECESEPGRGTAFDICLPVTDRPPADPKPPAEAAPAPGDSAPSLPPLPHTTILLADDEDIVRQLGAAVLRQQGYEVLEAENGNEAVEVFARESGRIALAVLDLTMPGMSGQDAFRQIRQTRPDARVMFASGYASEQLTDEEARGVVGFLKKPYRPRELVDLVRAALAESGHSISFGNGVSQ